MTNWLMIGITLGLFILVMVIFSRESLDYVAYALLFALISCVITAIVYGTTLSVFLASIEYEPLIFILSMQIIISVITKHNLFQWIALKTLHLTKGNQRTFFYLICIVSTFSASIIADVTVSIIFVPLVIQACRVLKIRPAPFLYGLTITINIGSIMTPFSSSENIYISTKFQLDMFWFLENTWLFSIVALLLTLLLLDVLILSKQEPVQPRQKKILLEIMNPKMVIMNRKHFRRNGLFFFLIIACLVIFSKFSYLIVLFAAILLCIFNGEKFDEVLAKIDWKVIFFFISLFLLIGNMEINGTFEELQKILNSLNVNATLLIALVVMISVSLLSGFLANSPTAIVGYLVLTDLFGSAEAIPNLILIAFILAINLGGNLLPQGAACDVMTLNIAKENNVEGFTYKNLFKRGGLFALFHIALCIVYLIIYYLITL